MGKLRSVMRQSRSGRDDELRAAHHRLFDEIEMSGSAPGRDRLVSDALQRLIDACEAYCYALHDDSPSHPKAS